jgi:hypothetical protein
MNNKYSIIKVILIRFNKLELLFILHIKIIIIINIYIFILINKVLKKLILIILNAKKENKRKKELESMYPIIPIIKKDIGQLSKILSTIIFCKLMLHILLIVREEK